MIILKGAWMRSNQENKQRLKEYGSVPCPKWRL